MKRSLRALRNLRVIGQHGSIGVLSRLLLEPGGWNVAAVLIRLSGPGPDYRLLPISAVPVGEASRHLVLPLDRADLTPWPAPSDPTAVRLGDLTASLHFYGLAGTSPEEERRLRLRGQLIPADALLDLEVAAGDGCRGRIDDLVIDAPMRRVCALVCRPAVRGLQVAPDSRLIHARRARIVSSGRTMQVLVDGPFVTDV
ncbi:hypothetical protein [Salinispira pacifica]